MAEPDEIKKQQFLYPTSRYQGEFSPQNLAFNANLQEFAQRIGYICNLETGGKISPQQAYKDIKELWKMLKRSKAELLSEPNTPDPPESD
ncbi:hypothetical protein [Synechococcus sp. PCC 6312]|uniref:DUF7219 family protein n=1 Tax=Synechococcus sp. (strain ATCC 27167 / PCC 6312) TaxID=195253 RepID=UPI00029EF519|nr:hypothetical protein [Synechococcus sp. PCC 6312]AFY60570.1 hypothetical protein Syn6312_1399 [Synechococcus sp. PCC 6312]